MEEVSWSDEYGFIREGKVYLRGYMNFPDRQIGEVKHSEEASVAYFRDRFSAAKQKVEELERLITEAQNKGSYLMKLLHLRQYLAEFDGLGDYIALFDKLDVLEEELRETISVNRVRNLEIKQALIQEAEALAGSTDWKETSEKFKELKSKWIKTGSVIKEQEEEIEEKFQNIVNGFFQRRKAFYDERTRQMNERLARYARLVQRAVQIQDSPDLDVTIKDFKRLQDEWKKVGKVPPKELGDLWKEFKRANDHFFTRYKSVKQLSGVGRPRPVDPEKLAQEKLCQEAEALLASNNINSAAERAKELLMEWKNIRVKPYKQDQQLAARFRATCDKIFELNYLMRVIKRRHFYFERKPLREQLEIKVNTMSYLIRKDREELDTYEGNVDGMNMLNKNQTMDKLVVSKLSIQKRKIGIKEMLLQQFKEELAAL
jgi:hypothetical protein